MCNIQNTVEWIIFEGNLFSDILLSRFSSKINATQQKPKIEQYSYSTLLHDQIVMHVLLFTVISNECCELGGPISDFQIQTRPCLPSIRLQQCSLFNIHSMHSTDTLQCLFKIFLFENNPLYIMNIYMVI